MPWKLESRSVDFGTVHSSVHAQIRRQGAKLIQLHQHNERYLALSLLWSWIEKNTDIGWTGCLPEYRSIQDAYKTSDKYASTVCFRVSAIIIDNQRRFDDQNLRACLLQAFEHLLDRELISFGDNRGRNQALEYRPVKLLVSSRELAESLKLNTTCPVSHLTKQFSSVIVCQYRSLPCGCRHVTCYTIRLIARVILFLQAVLQKLFDRERYM